MTQAMKDRASIIEESGIEQSSANGETSGESHKRTGHAVYDRSVIARLSCADIQRMSCSELIRAVRECRARELRPEADQRLEFFERRTLEQLIYILRRTFQEQKPTALSVSAGDEGLNAISRDSANQGAFCR